MKDSAKPKEVVVIHKHYHYNIPEKIDESKDEDEEEDEDEDEDEDVDENVDVVEKPKLPEKDFQFSQAFLNMVQDQVREQLSNKSSIRPTFV
jgi:hypothetical protein